MSQRRSWGWPLVPVYATVVAAKASLYQRGWLLKRRLGWPVVSVGSLSAGGAGKTPVVIALAELLKQAGWHIDVLSRGYARSGRGVERVDLSVEAAAERFGDEPVLIAQRSGAPVWVGKERFEAGKVSEATDNSANGMHLLDDGFQHRRLARTMDVVLVTAEDLADTLLPAGNLREGFGALLRADAVVIREQERDRIVNHLRGRLRKDAVVWFVERELRFPAPLGVLSAGLRPMAFCAIARPEGFAGMLAAAGCGVVETLAFQDHHAYQMRDMEKIVTVAKGCRATGFFTTAKDWVKLSEAMVKRLHEVGPVCVAELQTKFLDEAQVICDIEARVTRDREGRAS